MLVSASYKQTDLLFIQNERIKQDSSQVYQSFLDHENFYKKSCFSLIYNENTSQKKSESCDIKLNNAVNNPKSHYEMRENEFYAFGQEILKYGAKKEEKWRCPYCYHWWPMGQKCQNPKCPTNQWPKEDKKLSEKRFF